MKSYEELNAEINAIHQEVVEAKKNKGANAPNEIKSHFKEFGFDVGMMKLSLAEGRKK